MKKKCATNVEKSWIRKGIPQVLLEIALIAPSNAMLVGTELATSPVNERIRMTHQKTHLYLDLDGVFANFTKRAREIFKHFPSIHGIYTMEESKTQLQATLREQFTEEMKDDIDFWRELGWEPGGEELWDYIEQSFDNDHLTIITSPYAEDYARCVAGKKHWVKEKFSGAIPEERMIFTHDKHLHIDIHANNNQILIDDRGDHIDKWISVGGIGILHDSRKPERTLETLKHFAHKKSSEK